MLLFGFLFFLLKLGLRQHEVHHQTRMLKQVTKGHLVVVFLIN